MKFVCVIPAYKPDCELISFAKKLIDNDFLCVVVNDGSGMEFDSIFMQLPDRVVLLSHDKNRGKGSAIKTALAYIASNLPDAFGVVTADADGQHTIQAVTKARDMLIESPNALILGNRRFDNQVPLRSRFGNFVTRNVFALANNKYVYDTQTGLRAFSTSKIKEFLKIEGDKYEYEMNMLMFSARSGIEIKEFPIATIYINNNKSSHFNPVKDSFKIYSCIAKYSLSSFLSFLLDFALFALLIFLTKGLGQTQSILISEVGARSVSSVFNFFVNKNYVFSGDESTGKAFFKYALLAIFTLLADAILVIILAKLSVPETLAKLLAGAILFFINFLVQGKLVFRKAY